MQLPQGTIAGISILSLHQSKEIWGDPEEFRPERFLDAKNTIINANKILPFGLGKRVCIGESLARASLFSYFSSLMQRYTFKPSPKYKQPSTEPVYGFTLSPEKYFVVVEHR
jgi:methyl farnesoate epoxidase/farnesoate epoxidase